ncbi:predicted protein [Naegleria gruberi]|uniref:Sodium/potassium-transporting ATPase subunit alpha n=1 Tax=Naegleria gruberi TaxID=5762 RepID=D2V346_NAEGR|nr:uncharacterized protein NAEGRDRAFT_30663 [Naegleria gruberi]EFC48712.1 predicted protein [Naegleria gruberi]|eukprot:XP_002681456.1 predicted protein [Naegleria gruberi strain NEG-M]
MKQKSAKEVKFIKKSKKKAIDISEHELSVERVCETYGTSFNQDKPEKSTGLTQQVASERLKVNGPNQLTPPKKRPFIFKIIEQFTSLFALLLIVAGLLSFLNVAIERTTESYPNIFLGVILWFIVIMNATITLVQERSSEKVLQSFQQMQSDSCMVIRDGIPQKIPVEELVLGDLVRIEGGDKIPADLRVVSCSQLKLDNASLTGETEPQSRSVEMTSKNPLETNNLVFFGTLALEGSGYGIVIRCGNQTVIGQIALLAGASTEKKTPLRREIDSFVRKIAVLAFTMAIIFFCLGFAIGNSWFTNFLFAIGIIISNIPQGLIPTVTVCLTVSAKRLKAVNVLVKKLEHVETLGSTSVICSDKTGTLTQNRMTVVELWVDGRVSSVDYQDRYMTQKPSTLTPLTSYSKEGEEQLTTDQMLRRCSALCSKTYFVPEEDNLRKPILDRECEGDASETALVKFIQTRTDCATIEEFRSDYTELYSIPFNSKNKWMLSIRKNNHLPQWTTNTTDSASTDSKVLLLMKGAPERIIQRCSHIRVGSQTLPLDDNWKQNFKDAYDFFASKGERVLGFAQLFIDEHLVEEQLRIEKSGQTSDQIAQSIPMEGLCFLGMAGLTDPPKVGVPECIGQCKKAGIQVVMVTGDHPATAKAIAKQVGIIESDARTIDDIAEEESCDPKTIPYSRADAIVLHGEEIDKLTSKEWKQILKKKQIVFARTSPQQKLIIVTKFQELGHCVAVTGDGTNDSPALKKADVGVAMNISGSAVSKEAAAIILLDDNFASIVNGIKEGRLIFDNLKKSIAYTVSHLSAEIFPYLVFIVFSMPLPITGLLILCVDLGTELISAVSLAYETAESDIMSIPPRTKNQPLVSSSLLIFSYLQMGVIETLACFTNYFLVFAYYGIPPKYLWEATSKDYFDINSDKKLYIEETGMYLDKMYQHNVLCTAQTAFFMTIVICQWATLFSCKTRRLSIFTHGLLGNLMTYFGLIYSACLLVILIYVPFIGDYIFNTRFMIIDFWLYPIPWMFLMIFYDEMRKWVIRKLNFSFLFW